MTREQILVLALEKCSNPVDALAMADMMAKFLAGDSLDQPSEPQPMSESQSMTEPQPINEMSTLPAIDVSFTRDEIEMAGSLFSRNHSFQMVATKMGRTEEDLMKGYYSGLFHMKYRKMPSVGYRRHQLIRLMNK